jgi:hypothetical protein
LAHATWNRVVAFNGYGITHSVKLGHKQVDVNRIDICVFEVCDKNITIGSSHGPRGKTRNVKRVDALLDFSDDLETGFTTLVGHLCCERDF